MSDREIVRVLKRERLTIIREWRSRRARERENSNGPWEESAEQWAIRRIYEMVRQLKQAERLSELEVFVDQICDCRDRLRPASDHPFKSALYSIMGVATRGDRVAPMTRQRRFLIGEALIYADRHDVAAQYVICFIMHAGLRDIPQKLDERYIEPGFSAGG